MAGVWTSPEFSHPENAKAVIRSKHLTRELRGEKGGKRIPTQFVYAS
jgi:hypothetical protein